MPSTGEITGVPRVAKMSIPWCLRFPPSRDAPPVSATARGATPWTGTGK
jgi:hypothetical protein